MLQMLCLIMFAAALQKEVILSSGLKNWDRDALVAQYNHYKLCKMMGVISASSILVYNINEYGELDTYQTNDTVVTAEGFQKSVHDDIFLRAYPCIFCDATVGFCSNLNARLEQLYKKEAAFLSNLTQKVAFWKWDAVTIDMEPDDAIDWHRLTLFLIALSQALLLVHVPLYVWVGGNTFYDVNLYRSANIRTLSMDTYASNYEDFVMAAVDLFTKTDNTTHIGFGLLSSKQMSEQDMMKTVLWTDVANVPTLSLWSDSPDPFALKALRFFLT